MNVTKKACSSTNSAGMNNCHYKLLWRKSSVLSPSDFFKKKELEKDIQFRCIKNLSGFICFTSDYRSLDQLWSRLWQYILSNKQTTKCTCITLYNCTLHCTKRTRAQSVRRQQRKRTSVESEMVTYNHVTEVVRSKFVNHQAKRLDSREILILIVTSVGALIIPTIKQTATDIAHQTNKLNK